MHCSARFEVYVCFFWSLVCSFFTYKKTGFIFVCKVRTGMLIFKFIYGIREKDVDIAFAQESIDEYKVLCVLNCLPGFDFQ